MKLFVATVMVLPYNADDEVAEQGYIVADDIEAAMSWAVSSYGKSCVVSVGLVSPNVVIIAPQAEKAE